MKGKGFLFAILIASILASCESTIIVEKDKSRTEYLPALITSLHLQNQNEVYKSLEDELFEITPDEWNGFDAYSSEMITDTIHKYHIWGTFEKKRLEEAMGSLYIPDRKKVVEYSRDWRYYLEKLFPSPDLWVGAIRIGNTTKYYYSGKLAENYFSMLEKIKNQTDAYQSYSQIVENGGKTEYLRDLKSVNFTINYRGLAEYYFVGKNLKNNNYNAYSLSYGNLNNTTFYILETSDPAAPEVLYDYNLLCYSCCKSNYHTALFTDEYILEDFIETYGMLKEVTNWLPK